MTLTGMTLLGLYTCSLVALHRAGYLPPPPLVNSLCADVRLEALRDRPSLQPTHLIVGSSVAMDNFDSSKIAFAEPEAQPLNVGFCAAQAHQVSFVARYMTERFPSVRTVIAVVEPHDFRNCSDNTEQLFPPDAADDYIFRRRWLYGFYLRYFDLHSLQKNVRARLSEGPPGKWTDEWGDVPLNHQASGLFYGEFEGYDRTCFVALRRMADWLEATDRRLIVASTPMNPAWSELYDGDGTVRTDFASGIRSALGGTDAVFWDGERAYPVDRAQFVDAVHLRWPAAQGFTAALVAQTGLDSSMRSGAGP
ncbi:MAG TPA: hypothetical protein VH855_19855 [Acetobacteraceae bacterium]